MAVFTSLSLAIGQTLLVIQLSDIIFLTTTYRHSFEDLFFLKGTVQWDFLSQIFSLMESSQALYSVFKDFSNLASNSVRYSRFLIDSLQYFIPESPCSPYCLLRRVVTLRIILAESHHLLALSAQTLTCHLIRRVNTPRIDYYGESLLRVSFTAGSHCWQRRVIFENFEGLSLPLKGQWSKKWTIHVEYCSPRTMQKSPKYGSPKALFFTPFCNWQRGVDFLII
jgi:hypothetical protein